MCSCCRLAIRLPAAAGWRPSRAVCRTCCNGSSRYAICCPLCRVSQWTVRAAVRWYGGGRHECPCACVSKTYRAQRPCLPRESGAIVSKSTSSSSGACSDCTHLSTPLARIDDIILVAVLVEERLRVAARRVHGGQARCVRARARYGAGWLSSV